MSQPDVPCTDELLDKTAAAIAAHRREHGQGIDIRKLVVAMRQHDVGLIDTNRHRSWIDETVHMGALFRLNFWRKLAEAREPVPMILFCPKCGSRHIDQPDPANGWDNPPHRSHLCALCGLIWRPADICTVGVEKIESRGRLDVPIEELDQRGKIVQMPDLESAGFVGLIERISRKVINDVGDAFTRNRLGGYRR